MGFTDSQPGRPDGQGAIEVEQTEQNLDVVLDQLVSELESPEEKVQRGETTRRLQELDLGSMDAKERKRWIGQIRGEYLVFAQQEAKLKGLAIKDWAERRSYHRHQQIYLMLGSAVVLREIGLRENYLEELIDALIYADHEADQDAKFDDTYRTISSVLAGYLRQYAQEKNLAISPEEFDGLSYVDARNLVKDTIANKDGISDPDRILGEAGFLLADDH
ncbi:MAG: hypothetical protein AAB360_04305 [Patescibacteria group bacterium]